MDLRDIIALRLLPVNLCHGRLLGVLDIDSPRENRFDELDQKYLEEYAQIVVAASWSAPIRSIALYLFLIFLRKA
jgi:hypothetical protein